MHEIPEPTSMGTEGIKYELQQCWPAARDTPELRVVALQLEALRAEAAASRKHLGRLALIATVWAALSVLGSAAMLWLSVAG